MFRLPIWIWLCCGCLTLVILWIGAGVFFTDPYFTWTWVNSPYQTTVAADGTIRLIEAQPPRFRMDVISRLTAYARAGARIVIYRWLPESPLGTDERTVLVQLHQRRFNPAAPYVITGSHYSDLYVRNLGIFFNELLNDSFATSFTDLQNRQRIAVQTVALDLAFLRANQRLVTTIVPLGGSSFTGVNIYAEPSDALHAILFTLEKLRQSPATMDVANQLLAENSHQLQAEVERYISVVIDPKTQLTRREVVLSGARDGVKRQAAFFDTVIAWKTVQLAQQLNLVDSEHWPAEYRELLDSPAWKQKILEAYWQADAGFFANDLSEGQHVFGGDSLIAYSTGLLEIGNPTDAAKLARMIEHIDRQQLNQPFPLGYSRSNQQNEMHLTVKLFAPGYMGEGIWSHWGIEYIKVLLALSQTKLPQRCQYLADARRYLDIYEQKIAESGGFPELYGQDGQPFKTPAVRAVLHSGWVVNYEAARTQLENYLRITSCRF